MPIAAVPKYLAGLDFSTASPGLRFGMYLCLWGRNNRTNELLWTTYDINYRVSGRNREERRFEDENKTAALQQARSLNSGDRAIMAALRRRQSALAGPLLASGQLLSVDAAAVAPFTTGLGNEHPLENGFAFLNPYGLPYLPGSGVKGVLRQAARELASGEWGETGNWSEEQCYALQVGKETIPLSSLDVLFGLEPSDGASEHVRGVLTFWDVVPQIEDDALMVEIMTPHQKHYYQDGASPHESGQPNPISFLTVPPGSRFLFHVTCDLARLNEAAPDLAERERWKDLLGAAFKHAFDWLGFGAKTAVGYGQMRVDEAARREREEKAREEKETAERKAKLAAMTEEQRKLTELREWYEEDRAADRKEPGGRLANGLAELLKEADGWDAPWRTELADLAEAIYGFIGWGSSKKKKERRERIAALRG